MTPEKQRIAIADACGWKIGNFDCLQDKANKLARGDNYLPDYINDLNAMHEAEKILTEQQQYVYSAHLVRLAGWCRNQDLIFKVASATAAQKAEAFCLTIDNQK
jgi:hypothetical protein